MKFKYLSIQNCRELLPSRFDIRFLREFDCTLEVIDTSGDHIGAITKAIQRNESTQGKKPWDRQFVYDIDICPTLDYRKNEIEWRIQDYYIESQRARSGINKRIHAMFSLIYEDGGRWTFKMPLQYLLKGWGDANEGYQGYSHCVKLRGMKDLFGEVIPDDTEFVEKCYSGITKRNWLQRLEEHLRQVRQGGKKLFHQAWREAADANDVVYTSFLQHVNLSYEEVMQWEEMYVDQHTLAPKGLNMIPGGFEGNKYLYKHRITDRLDIDLEERERAVTEYALQHPLKGIPNPFMSELWKTDEHYLKVIAARDKTLSPDQVRKIRELGKLGYSASTIKREVDALNVQQVKNVLMDRTYKRIH
ncbi:MAG: hypothetical protein ABW092_15365 [Candidatus Thiodiazotropha sp.]